MHILTITLSVVCLLMCGCAKLEVKVDVLDPEVVAPIAENDYIQDNMEIILAEDENQTKQIFADIKNTHFSAYVHRSSALKEKASKLDDGKEKTRLMNLARNLQTDFGTEIGSIYDSRQTEWIATNKKIKTLYSIYEAEQDATKKASFRKQLVLHIESRDLMLHQLREFGAKDVDKQTHNLNDAESSSIKQNLAKKSKMLFESGGLIDSRYSFYVVKAPDENWAEYYDRSFGKGVFGNTDIAIKALGAANFTVKGLTFNPADVANAASKVTTQAVLLAAQISGVPVNISGTPSGDGAELAKSSARIAHTVESQNSAAIELRSQKAALLRIAQSILSEKEVIQTGTPQERAESIAAIKAIFDSQLSRLTIQTTEN